MEPSQLHGVVIITLPPADNPEKGKTITSIFTLSPPNYPSPSTTQQQDQNQNQNQPNIHLTSSQQPQRQNHFFFFKSLFNSPTRALGLLCISILAILMWTSLTSSDTLYELRNSEEDQEVDSFIFPLYSKLDVHKTLPEMLEIKLGRVVSKDDLMMVDDGVEHKDVSKMGSFIASPGADSSSIFPVNGNVYPYGLYYVSLVVGNPPRPYHLDIDTGSDLTWIQCDAPCTSCAKGPHPLYKPMKGTLVSSDDSLCKEVQSNQKHGYCKSCPQCDYEIQYADLSSSMGVLARDKLQLVIANGTFLNPSIVFGCGYDQQGQLSVSPAKTDGILGLTGARISFPSQLASKGIIRNVVGHCIARNMDNHGYMFLGDDFLPQRGLTWVPMLNSHSINSYHAEISKLTCGSEQLRLGLLDKSVGQVVFDSGSSYTYFTKEAYSDLVTSLEDYFGEELVQDKLDPTLPMCWRAKSPIRSLKDVKEYFRPLTLHFGGRWWIFSRKLLISPEGYLIISNKGNVCLGILDGSDIYDVPTIILGDISMHGHLVVYDNVNQKIGWVKSTCEEPQRYKSLPFFL